MRHIHAPFLPLLMCLVVAGCAPPALEQAAPEVVTRRGTEDGVTVAELSNGLTVILKAKRATPVVSVRAYVRAGGMYEGRYLGCGLSHFLEHLVAKESIHDSKSGGARQPAEKRSRTLRIGGQSNAYTSHGHTCYHISAAAGKAMECIDLIADQMTRPGITPDDFRREHGVVQRELEMRNDDLDRLMWYTHMADAFRSHPVAVPVIGYAEPLRRVAMEDVLSYHRRMYVPQNMVFVVVGDIDVATALLRVRERFAGFERGRTPSHSLPPVEPITGVRRVVRPHEQMKDVNEWISFRTIPLVHEDLYALDVLSYVLTEGQSSRLVETVRRQARLVTSVSSSSWTPAWGKGIFTISFRARPDKADAAAEAILGELRRVVADGVTEAELARAKRQKQADEMHSRQTVESIAKTLGTDYLSTGDVNFSKDYTRRIQAVTAAQVRAVAKKYFTFDAMAITRMTPPVKADPDAPKAAEARPKLTMFRLPNGLRVVMYPSESAGLVSMTFVAKGGVLLEDGSTNGVGYLTAMLAAKGAGERTAEQISAFFDEAGGSIGGAAGYNTFYWRATVLDDRFDEALEIFADVIQRPIYAPKELDIIRPVVLTAIARQDEDPEAQLFRFFRKKFFTGSPYAMKPLGRGEVVEKVTSEQLAAYHKANIRAGSSVLAVFGTFDAGQAKAAVEKLFADLPAGRVGMNVSTARKMVSEGEKHVLRTRKENAVVVVGAPGMKFDNLEDRFAITVLDAIISGYRLPSGWLHTELRGKELVYSVHAYNMMGLAPGAFVAYATCRPEKRQEVTAIIERNLRKAADYEPTREEVDQAVNLILTAEMLENQSMSDLAFRSALDELYGLGYDMLWKLRDYYAKVTPADVARVGKKYLGGGYVVTSAAPEEE